MKTSLKPENRSWPRENSKHTQKEELLLNVAGRSDLFPIKSLLRSSLCALSVLLWQSTLAGVHYVDLNSTNATPPYTNWATAATMIQDAVDASVAGDEIVVTNGTYGNGRATASVGTLGTLSRVAVDKPLALRSVNGPQFTLIRGGNFPANTRCVYLTNGASLSGFTLTGGFGVSRGGGVWCASSTALVSNCVVSGNVAKRYPGDTSVAGGGAYGGTLNDCTLTGNSASVIINFISNYPSHAIGGGAANSTLNNCTLAGNSASLSVTVGQVIGVEREAHGGGAYYCTLNNCTLTGNWASGPGPYSGGGGASGGTLNNCIVFSNSPDNYGSSGTLNYCCTTPDPGGIGNITNAPLFVDNLRLQSNSPCINAGLNALAPAGSDLDGNPRIAGGTVDIGAYEFQSPPSMISYAWLQHFNLPITSATDTVDPDGDGVNSYREWLAGSDPTNPFSFPPLLTLIPYGANVTLTWPTNAVGFTLQSTTNLGSPAAWNANSPAPVVIGRQNVIISPITGPQQLFRLKH